MNSPSKSCSAVFLGRIDYQRALELQMELSIRKKRGGERDVLLLLEHPPTVTLGRNGDWRHLRVTPEALEARGVAAYEVDRGGDITYHGPGQLVGYPIFELRGQERDVRRYMHTLEEALIRTLACCGIEGARLAGKTGVWTEQGKIAAMGVHISRWITRHGFALNVDTDLDAFELIVPCGLPGARVTSMRAVAGRSFELAEVAARVAAEIGELFGRSLEWIDEEALRLELGRRDGAPRSSAVA